MSTPPVTTAILIITGLTTFYAFRRREIWERWMFNPQAILRSHEYHRLFSCGLIHADWIHFGFNAFSFYSFARGIEIVYGPLTLLVIYGAAILGGSLLSLIIHRHHDYRALGASGGVCGIIFASIFLLPGAGIYLFPIPFAIPPAVYAVFFLVGSYWAHRRGSTNIGHDAHLGGAIIGLLAAAALYPTMVSQSPALFAVVLVLSGIILYWLIAAPSGSRTSVWWRKDAETGGERERRYRENRHRNEKLAEIDALLDKAAKHGIHSLSPGERERLETLSREVHGKTNRE